jgi:hypothetical protein
MKESIIESNVSQSITIDADQTKKIIPNMDSSDDEKK